MAAAKKLSVIERRLQGPSVLQVSSQPIPLKEKGWTLYWDNNDVRTDQVWHTVNVLGWDYVAQMDLDCNLDDIGARAVDGRVVRGERGKEVLLKMRTPDYERLQMKKARENIARTFNKGKQTASVLNAVGSAHGSEAAEFIQKSGLEIVDHRERVALDE